MSAVVFYYRRSELTTDSKFTIRSVFSTGGSFGYSRGKNWEHSVKGVHKSLRQEGKFILNFGFAKVWFQFPEGPRIEKIQSREAILKKSSFQYGMKFSIENEIFIPGPSLAAEKQGLGLKFSIRNEIFKPRMKISSENENFVRGGMLFSCVRARTNFFDPRALWVLSPLTLGEGMWAYPKVWGRLEGMSPKVFPPQ